MTTSEGAGALEPSALFAEKGAVAMTRHAHISQDGLYRYSLHREWRDTYEQPRWVTFVMLNPSTADADLDDPTIRRCIGFAKALGGTGLAVVNLYAYRATQPADLWRCADPVGPENDRVLAMFLDMAERYGHPIIAAWGAHAKRDRVAAVEAMPGAHRLQALHVTKTGAPGHPLYLPAASELRPWPELEHSIQCRMLSNDTDRCICLDLTIPPGSQGGA